jgi:RNA recognition motif-containing protein
MQHYRGDDRMDRRGPPMDRPGPGRRDLYRGRDGEENKRTLFIGGIDTRLRAKDLAHEFERFGRLVRCDIPAPKHPGQQKAYVHSFANFYRYAFVEYEDPRDAADAFHEMQDKQIQGSPMTIQVYTHHV